MAAAKLSVSTAAATRETERTDLLADLLELGSGAAGEEDVETGASELKSKVATDSSGSARHDCDLGISRNSGKGVRGRTGPSSLVCAELLQLKEGERLARYDGRERDETYGDAGSRQVNEHLREAQDVGSEPSCADNGEGEGREGAVGSWRERGVSEVRASDVRPCRCSPQSIACVSSPLSPIVKSGRRSWRTTPNATLDPRQLAHSSPGGLLSSPERTLPAQKHNARFPQLFPPLLGPLQSSSPRQALSASHTLLRHSGTVR